MVGTKESEAQLASKTSPRLVLHVPCLRGLGLETPRLANPQNLNIAAWFRVILVDIEETSNDHGIRADVA